MRDKIKSVAKMVVRHLVRKSWKSLLIIIMIPIIVATSIALLYYGTTLKVQEKTSELFNDVTKNVEISEDNNSYKINKDYMKKAKNKLKSMGVNSNTLGLDGYEDYLTKFLEAEIVTSFPQLGDDGLQGAVHFNRASYDGTTTQLKYLKYDDFYKKNPDELRDYFTIDPKDWTVHVQTLTSEGAKTIEKIDYKSQVERFAMPFEFPIALAQVTQNAPFALAVVDLAKKSNIEFTIAESKTTVTTDVTTSYTRTVNTYDDATGAVTSSSSYPVTHTSQKVETSYSSSTFLSYAHVWIADYGSAPKYEHPKPTVTTSTKSIGGGDSARNVSEGSTTITSTSGGTETTKVTTEIEQWEQGKTDIAEHIKSFTELILRDKNSMTEGGGLIDIAKKCHDYVANKHYTYSMGTGHVFPKGDGSDTNTTIDCSAYVSWVLKEAGYDGGMMNSSTIGTWGLSKGWKKISNYSDVQAGDICIYSRTCKYMCWKK